jgi:hypothetical protein
MLVVPDSEATVSGQMVQKLVTLSNEKGIDMGVAATRGTFSSDAQGIADANGVHLLDTETLSATVESEGLEDLVEEFSTGQPDGEDADSITDRLPEMSGSLPAVGDGGSGLRTLVMALLAIGVVIAAIQFLGMGGMLGGFIASLPVPDLGVGLGGGGYTMTAVSLSEGNATPVDVRWNARTQTTVVAPNGESFAAPEGKQFVVVELNVSNPRNESLVFRADHLALATGNTRYGNQPLQGASGQLPMVVEPGSAKSGYVVYTVPKASESATLLGLPGPKVPPMTFERDRALPTQVGGA